MAVSLKKPAKVDLSKPDKQPRIREYTPVHLLDEEETIKRQETEAEDCISHKSEPITRVNVSNINTNFIRLRFNMVALVFASMLFWGIGIGFLLYALYISV